MKRLNDHMSSNKLHEPHQSAYRSLHSTETVLLKIMDDMLHAVDSKKCVLLCLLDLSAAFDTVDHNVLMSVFQNDLGITGSSIEWLRSYFSNRFQSVCVDGVSSASTALYFSLPQGSVLGPFSFPPYESGLAA